jgi:hypothetical protein
VAIVEFGAACVLVAAPFLPWFMITYLNSAGIANGQSVTSITWVNSRDYAQTLTNILIPLGAIAAALTSLAGLAFAGRVNARATVVAFAVAGVGVVSQLSEIRSGSMDPPGFSATSPGFGLWLFAGAAALGVATALVDLALPVLRRSSPGR